MNISPYIYLPMDTLGSLLFLRIRTRPCEYFTIYLRTHIKPGVTDSISSFSDLSSEALNQGPSPYDLRVSGTLNLSPIISYYSVSCFDKSKLVPYFIFESLLALKTE